MVKGILIFVAIIHVRLSGQAQVRPYAPELFSPSYSGAVCGFSPDGRTIYFVREDSLSRNLTLFEAKNKQGRWTDEKKLPFSGDYQDLGGRLSRDGKTFYFTSNRPDAENSSGAWKVWRARSAKGTWSKPEPVAWVNNRKNACCVTYLENDHLLFSGDLTKENEWTILALHNTRVEPVDALSEPGAWQWPSYFDPVDEILFLNSMKRPDGLGMDDIYFSKRVEGKWSKPANLGTPVNSNFYEDGAILSPDRKWLIFNRHQTAETPSQVLCIPWSGY